MSSVKSTGVSATPRDPAIAGQDGGRRSRGPDEEYAPGRYHRGISRLDAGGGAEKDPPTAGVDGGGATALPEDRHILGRNDLRVAPAPCGRRLLDAAAALFAALPFDDVLMEDVAHRSGVSRALLYRHFPNKLDLFAAIYQRAVDRLLAANRVLAGDPVIQAIISEELAILRQRLLDVTGLEGHRRDVVSAVLMSWLIFVRTLSVDWLANQSFDRTELRDACSGALLGALEAAGIAAPG